MDIPTLTDCARSSHVVSILNPLGISIGKCIKIQTALLAVPGTPIEPKTPPLAPASSSSSPAPKVLLKKNVPASGSQGVPLENVDRNTVGKTFSAVVLGISDVIHARKLNGKRRVEVFIGANQSRKRCTFFGDDVQLVNSLLLSGRVTDFLGFGLSERMGFYFFGDHRVDPVGRSIPFSPTTTASVTAKAPGHYWLKGELDSATEVPSMKGTLYRYGIVAESGETLVATSFCNFACLNYQDIDLNVQTFLFLVKVVVDVNPEIHVAKKFKAEEQLKHFYLESVIQRTTNNFVGPRKRFSRPVTIRMCSLTSLL